MQLIICEKPSVAADVARALSAQNKFEKTEWGFASPAVLVAAAAGHLVAELYPEEYDEKYKVWSYEDLPMIPERVKYKPRDARAVTRLKQLAGLIKREDVTEIVNACDAGREGELIFKLILQYARGESKTVTRAWFSSMTPQAIQAAFNALRPDREMQPLEAAARCRSEADWLVGMNATRAASCTLGGGRMTLSLGRVQTPTLALIVTRDLEIEGFTPEDYFQVEATFDAQHGSYKGLWRSSKEKDALDRLPAKEDAEKLAARVKSSRKAYIDAVEVREEDVAPPRLFDLTDLQREANKRYGMTATRTLAAAQSCYETHKVLSYPRTDSRYLPSDMASVVPGLIKRIKAADAQYAAAADAVLLNCDPSRIINDAKVTDHHAIIPTDSAHDLSKLSDDERKIYDLAARRLLAALLPPQRLERTVVWTVVEEDAGDLLFRSSGRRELEQGWRLAWPEASQDKKVAKDPSEQDEDAEDTGDTQDLPELAAQEAVKMAAVRVLERQTKPPARFNEASLLGALATAGRLVEDEEMADAMRERGLGTPATRAAILERLVDVEYIVRQGRQLRATDKGRGVIIALGEHPLVHPDLTGEWEQRLRQLERAKPDDASSLRDGFSRDVKQFTREICDGFRDATPEKLRAGRRKIADCPVQGCAGTVVEGKKAWGCDTYKSKDDQGCGLVVWKEQSGKKLAEKQLLVKLEAIRSGKEAPPQPRGERVVLGPCPSASCSGEVVERQKSWGCSSWKSPKETGCGYVIWKSDPDGSVVDEARAKDMLALGRSNQKERKPAFAPCPRCKGDIIDRGKFYGCNSWQTPKKTGCGTVLWKMQAGREATPEEALAQLEEMKGTEAPKKTSRKSSGPRPSR